ncbi:MAG: SDR family oxidoreductase [Bacteroidetes bacterium]|nr:SDR family oxidoreductase [Bacteroidota bacterium]
MQISLKGKKAIVGGSTQGIGKAIAFELAECGAEITLLARNEEKLKQIISELPCQYHQKHNYLVVDFSDFGNYKKVISDYFKNHSVDILINNTTGPNGGGAFDKSVDDYQTAFDLLFKTVCFISMEAIKGMKDNHFGRIINVSSITVKEPKQNLVLSNSIRSAVLSWSKTLSRDVAPFGITVNNILTGFFDTERLNSLYQKQADENGIPLDVLKKKMMSEIPVGRFGDPKEYAYLTAFLASENAAYITGTNIPIDGGLLKSI